MHAVFLDKDSMHPADLDFSPIESCVSGCQYYTQTTPDQIEARIQNADIVISNKVFLTASVLKKATTLKLICVAATGTNNIDLQTAIDQNILVSNARGYGTASVVQHTFSLILALTTGLFPYRDAIAQGQWSRAAQFCLMDFPVRELAGKNLGIVGYGTLGKAVAQVASAFGMHVLVAQRKGAAPSADRLAWRDFLQTSDVISLHCPLTPDTMNLIGAAEFSLMKPTTLLINVARGGIVDERALVDALQRGQIAGAGFDCLTDEPPSLTHPLLDATIPNLILTPHSAWTSREARQRIVDQIAENIRAFQMGSPIRLV